MAAEVPAYIIGQAGGNVGNVGGTVGPEVVPGNVPQSFGPNFDQHGSGAMPKRAARSGLRVEEESGAKEWDVTRKRARGADGGPRI